MDFTRYFYGQPSYGHRQMKKSFPKRHLSKHLPFLILSFNY